MKNKNIKNKPKKCGRWLFLHSRFSKIFRGRTPGPPPPLIKGIHKLNPQNLSSTATAAEDKQVTQRATIAHLSPMCQHLLISNKPASKVIKKLNSFQIREQLFFQGLFSTSNVSRLNVPEIKHLVVFKHVLVTKEQASMETSLSHYNSLEYFSNTQGALIPQ